LLVRDISRYRSAFELPSAEELSKSSLPELTSLAQTIDVELPFALKMKLLAHLLRDVPASDAPGWKKASVKKDFEELDKELNAYELRLAPA
jgi:hypothetical protein